MRLANTAVAVFLVDAPDQDVARLEFVFLEVDVVLEEFPGLLSEVALYVALLGIVFLEGIATQEGSVMAELPLVVVHGALLVALFLVVVINFVESVHIF